MPALIERRKMTRSTYQALKRHILRDREKRKQEHEAGLALERQRKETERRKRLENENKNCLQQTKDELVRLDKELEDHKKEKSKLFAQLKRILESENTKKVNEKKHETQLYPGGPSGHPNSTVHFLSGTGHMGRPVMFKPAMPPVPQAPPVHATVTSTPGKRQRSVSPNPPISNVFSFHHGNQSANLYSGNKYASSSQDSYTGYSPHNQQKVAESHKNQKLLEPQIHSSSDTYQSSHPMGHMLQQKVPHTLVDEQSRSSQQTTSQRHSTTPVKGSIVTGYAMHPSPSHQPGRERLPPGQGSAKPMYQPRDRPSYY